VGSAAAAGPTMESAATPAKMLARNFISPSQKFVPKGRLRQ
jgi:hypothetical protein